MLNKHVEPSLLQIASFNKYVIWECCAISHDAESIRNEIFDSITAMFRINVICYSPIELGYMNLKWNMVTDAGDFFVKQYNKIRYPESLYDGLEIALTKQDSLYKAGIPSPKLFSNGGKYVLSTPSGEHFVLMESCEGNMVKAGTANEQQMYHLGQVTGRMHLLLNDNITGDQPLHWNIRKKEWMNENWNRRWREAHSLQCDITLSALEVQRKIIEETDLDIFSECEPGWGHWDLFVDNILFNPDSVSAILDFDRMHYVYPEFDISRSILSCALHNDSIQLRQVAAFIAGYREYRELSIEKLIRSIKLTWWKEAEWVWVGKERDTQPLRRFRIENRWVGENWDKLHDIFGGM